MPELPWDALPWRLERRASPSAVMRIAAPLIAAAAMLATSFLIFAFLGKDPLNALDVFFIEPLNSLYGWGELLLKATPLALCALGLALGFSANVWNIGAEGQLTLGAICGGGVALYWGAALGPLARILLPLLFDGQRANLAFPLMLGLAAVSWVFSTGLFAGYRMRVGGQAPAAAAYAGFSERRNVWLALMIGGGAAGLAGVCEVVGPIGRLQVDISPGYGFAAIIVAFVGRLHPVGIVLAALLMSLLYLGGESVQLELQLPAAVTGLFQGMLLFYLLAADLFVGFRLRRVPRVREARA